MEDLFAAAGMKTAYLVAGPVMLLALVLWNNFSKPKTDPRDNNYY